MSTQTLDLIPLLNVPADTFMVTGAIDISQWNKYSVQTVFTYGGSDTATGEVKTEVSNNGDGWAQYGSANIYDPSTVSMFVETQFGVNGRFIRIVVNPFGGTGGTLTAYLHLIK